jgi:GTPase
MSTERTPMVAIVGRPNVGKSTLFNRLVGRRQAIVHDMPGVTRDRISARVEIEPGQTIELVDTGGLVPGDDPLGLGEQVLLAVEEADALLFIVDGKEGLTSPDERVWDAFRSYGKPTILVVNKGDTNEARDRFYDFYRLGFERQVLVSAEHALGMGELIEALVEELPPPEAVETPPEVPAIAVVGRPNVGKSSLVNRLLGQERTLVSPVAGTTRDPVDTLLHHEGKDYLLIDTAGIRRRSQVSDAPEGLAVMMARRQIERADAVVLVVDATAGVTSGDLAIAGAVWEMGRPAVVLLNKWDLLDEEGREKLEENWPRLVQILSDPPRVNGSALTGRHVDKIFPALDRVLEDFRTEVTTGALNKIFLEAVARRSPPAMSGRPFKVYYATQVGTGPPTFMLFTNRILPRSDTYRRYLENRLREALALPGVPLRLVVRRR